MNLNVAIEYFENLMETHDCNRDLYCGCELDHGIELGDVIHKLKEIRGY